MNVRKITVISFIVIMVLFMAVIREKPACAAEDELTKDNFLKLSLSTNKKCSSIKI